MSGSSRDLRLPPEAFAVLLDSFVVTEAKMIFRMWLVLLRALVDGLWPSYMSGCSRASRSISDRSSV